MPKPKKAPTYITPTQLKRLQQKNRREHTETPVEHRQAQVRLDAHNEWIMDNQVWVCGCGGQEFVIFANGECACAKCKHINVRIKAMDVYPKRTQ